MAFLIADNIVHTTLPKRYVGIVLINSDNGRQIARIQSVASIYPTNEMSGLDYVAYLEGRWIIHIIVQIEAICETSVQLLQTERWHWDNTSEKRLPIPLDRFQSWAASHDRWVAMPAGFCCGDR